MSSSKILLGLLAGVAAGAIVGLLATNEGAKIRKTISRKGNRYAEDLKGSFNNFLDSVSDKYDDLKDEATDESRTWQNRAKKIVY